MKLEDISTWATTSSKSSYVSSEDCKDTIENKYQNVVESTTNNGNDVASLLPATKPNESYPVL